MRFLAICIHYQTRGGRQTFSNRFYYSINWMEGRNLSTDFIIFYPRRDKFFLNHNWDYFILMNALLF